MRPDPSTNLVTLDTVAASVPQPVSPNSAFIAAELERFATAAHKAVSVAGRAIIDDEDSYGRGADVVKAINDQLKNLDAARKLQTKPFDDAKKTLMELYNAPGALLTEAKSRLTEKMTRWHRAEEARKREEAAKIRAAQEAEAKRLAEAQAALGDAAGADRILEEAATIKPAETKVRVTGTYGATAGTRKTNVGTVTDKRRFLSWLAVHGTDQEIDDVAIGQRMLNNLAARVLSPDHALSTVPGFKAEVVDSLTVK